MKKQKKEISRKITSLLFLTILCTLNLQAAINVSNVKELVNAVNNGSPGDIIIVSSGIYELTSQLVIKSGITIKGAGNNLTIIKAGTSWDPGTTGLPASETNANAVNKDPYLFKIENISDVTISDMTLTAPKLHGAVFANKTNGLTLLNLNLIDFIWSAIQTFDINHFVVHDCIFEDAGGTVKWKGAAIFNNTTNGGEFYNCHIYKTPDYNKGGYVGFKGRGNKNTHIHHNTVEVNFSLEYMHANCENIEIDHNMFIGTMSIPMGGGGGTVITSGYSFWIHHNWLKASYTIELPRNSLIIDHNLFDFAPDQDGGNLLTCHDKRATLGPIDCHDNLIKNPGRGLFWSGAASNRIKFYNNHIIANTTITPRTEGLFGFTATTDFSTIEIKDNIIECIGKARSLFRNKESCASIIENNTLKDVTDTGCYSNPDKGNPRGLTGSMNFKCGYKSKFLVDNWKGGLAP